MKLISSAALAVLFLAFSNIQAAEFSPPDGVKSLSADELRTTFVGNTAVGTNGWKEFYAADGTIEGLSYKNQQYAGKWKIDPDRMCYAYKTAEFDTCSFIGIDTDGVIRYYDTDRGREKGSARLENGRQL
jgi:hypothetical protein